MERPPMERALSTDVVMDIVLSHLKVKDLLSCRKVSKFWNKTASSVLRRRSTAVTEIIWETDLMELQECVATSSDFPFTGLTFSRSWRSSAGPLRFLENHGARFTSLFWGTSSKTTRLQDIAQIINRLPRLSILEMGLSGWSHSSPIPFESSDSAAGQEDGRILSLPSLRTLRISSELNEDVLREVCTASSPSVRIECLRTSYETLRALKSFGKLQAVSVVKVRKDEEKKVHALRVDKWLSTQTPALTKLDFEDGGCISRKGLMKLLISSQHTLKELSLEGVCPSELLSECPVLAKLTTLSVCLEETNEYLFQGNHGHKFPALTELKLYIRHIIRISDGLFIVPTVTSIILEGYAEKDAMTELAQAFPNVHTIGLNYSFYSELEEETFKTGESFPSEIWSVREFKQLEKLRIREFSVRPSYKEYKNMDSFLTGIPLSICRNMQNQKPELMANLIQSPSVQSFSEVLRVNPSLLQLKNLKELVICVKLEDGLEELPEEPPFMSMISVWFALGMMPNLEAKFVYDYHILSVDFFLRNNDKAVTMLKDAFKHVQPHVQLEPFFY